MTRTRQVHGLKQAAVTNSISASTHDNLDEDMDQNDEIENNQTMDENEIEHDVSMNDEDETNTDVVSDNFNTDNTDQDIKALKSNVWPYFQKLGPEKAKCKKCPIPTIIKTTHGSTSTLRKHLINKHRLVHLALPSAPRPKSNSNASISREKKNRLDHLATVAIIEDGRTFGDLRKSGIAKFIDEAQPGDNVFFLYKTTIF